MIIRLATVGEISEALNHINSSVRVIKDVSKSVSGTMPNLEKYAYGVGPILNEAFTDLQNILPSIDQDLNSDESSKIIEKALKLAQEELAKNHLESSPLFRNENRRTPPRDKSFGYNSDGKVTPPSDIQNFINQNNEHYHELENAEKIGTGSILEDDKNLLAIQNKKNKLVDE
jgi:hypothetical protein